MCKLYVEKVFIAQKTSEDRGGKLREADKKKDTGESLGYRFTEEELGGGRGYIECRKKEGQTGGIYAVAKTHRQTG